MLDERMKDVPLHEIFILHYFTETKDLILEYLRMIYKVNRLEEEDFSYDE